ncbi:hypothetical protein Leryth_002910 [Lithospermum erythrorhizon]|nr:hypothetical protein Leryth_002910 [Lithospermum erythrorhizon]
MDTASLTPDSQPSSNDDNPRVKLLCSFSGCILPRPQDGKLRYVGGETRIVSVPRDIDYDDLMVKMREIFEGAEGLKYQQPDEDLDALVSVVNDDDVTNMMEEYDKLGAGNGFTRLRIFLVSQSDQECSFADGDEINHERWYVDALNSLNESPEFTRQQSSDFHRVVSTEDVHLTEQYFNRMNLDGSLNHQRNFDLPMAHVNLRHLRIPPPGSLQTQQSVDPRQNDLEVPWSPSYYSPRQTEINDPRPSKEFPRSPSSSRFHTPYSEFSDQRYGQMPEEYNSHQVNHVHEHPIQYTDNLVLLPTGPVPIEKPGFPGNILHPSNVYEGNSKCENCRVSKRNQAFPTSPWNPEEQPHREFSTGNGYHQGPNICAVSPPYRDTSVLNSESNMNYPYVSREQRNHWSMYNDIHRHDGGWFLQHQSQLRAEELRHVCGAGRVTDSDNFVTDNAIPTVHANVVDRPHMPSHLLHQEGPSLVQGVPELGNQMFNDQAVATGTPVHIPPINEQMVRQANPSFVYGADNISQVPHGHGPSQTIFKNIHSPMQDGLCNASGFTQMANDSINPGFMRTTAHSPMLRLGMESPQKNLGIDVRALPQYSHGQPFMMPSSYTAEPDLRNENNVTNRLGDEIFQRGDKEINQEAEPDLKICNGTISKQNIDLTDEPLSQSFRGSVQGQIGKRSSGVNPVESDLRTPHGQSETLDDMACAKQAMLENVMEVGAELQGGIGSDIEHVSAAKSVQNEPHQKVRDMNEDLDIDSDNDNKIEPTAAEEEAIKNGLQTVKNDDLEEIRELGSGTYGSVFHGKWKGSDVAVKRIKASYFAGKSSERERLIADFWKEALITIDRRKSSIQDNFIWDGNNYMGRNIVHFDLKCENLLVNMRDPHRPVCKIGDLGLSKVKQHTLVSGGVRGTLPWMAPELLSGKTNMVSDKIDVYSFGIVMWELLTGDQPYSDMHSASIIGGIVNDSLRPEIPTWCDPEWKSLMESCWATDPGKRPSFCEISQKLRTMAAAMNLK